MKKLYLTLLISLFLFTGCNKKNLDGEKFTSIMEKKGFRIYNVIEQYNQGKQDLVKTALIASNENAGYQIEFLIFKSVDACKNSFTVNRSAFRENKTEKDKETSVSKDKYSKYTLTSKDTYYVVSRKGDTLMYLDVDGSYKNEVDSILSELGF